MCFLYLTCDYSTLAHKLTVIKQMINVICSYKECFTESKPLTVPKSINVILLQYWKRKLLKAGGGMCRCYYTQTYAEIPQKRQGT